MSKHRQASVVDQQKALHRYLDDLLMEVPEAEPEPETLPVREQAPVIPMPLPNMPLSVPEPEPEPESVATTPAEPVTEAASAESAPAETNGRPGWAQAPFQCLLFQVGGLSLAVPLVKLNGVIPWSDELTEMPGHSPAFLGLLRHLEQNVKIIDTARMVLPENQTTDLAEPADRLKHIILIGEGRWGLACDSIGEVLTLDPGDVKWRSRKGKRPWLAGTVMEHLCAVMDVDDFSHLLEQG